jgi:hypothetical protein
MPRESSAYKFGESAVMPQGRPFRLSIEGVDTEYELVHHLDSAGRIHMSLDRAGQSSRRSMQDAQRHVDDDDDGPYDPKTGELKDGRSIRVPLLEMRDNRNNTPLIINSGIDWGRDKFRRDGTRKRRKAKQADPDPDLGETSDHSDHQPGNRFGDAAGRATVDAAYNQMVADLCSAWQSPERKAQNISDAQRETVDAPPAGVSASEWARAQRILQDAAAWRTPAPTYDAGPETGARTREIPSPPKGDVYAPVGYGARSGDLVNFNGAPATLVEREGFLYAVVIDVGPTRSGKASGGAPPTRTDAMTADQGQAHKDAAWNEMVAAQREMWRTPA